MKAGSVFFDKNFQFNDGEVGEKLILAIGSHNGIILVVKTTSQQHGRSTSFGCHIPDRYPNFYLPTQSSAFTKNTWICLDEFYEFNYTEVLQKRFIGDIKPVFDLDNPTTRLIQDCALQSLEILGYQEDIITSSLVSLTNGEN